jgi:AbrB family looped-hinge helix DNA binding protein
METATLSSKGQVVIPKPIRDAHRWKAGTRLIIEDSADGILIRPAHSFPETELAQGVGCAGYKGPAVPLETMKSEVDLVIRKEWSGRKRS